MDAVVGVGRSQGFQLGLCLEALLPAPGSTSRFCIPERSPQFIVQSAPLDLPARCLPLGVQVRKLEVCCDGLWASSKSGMAGHTRVETASTEEDFLLPDPQNSRDTAQATQRSSRVSQEAEGAGRVWARALTVVSVGMDGKAG